MRLTTDLRRALDLLRARDAALLGGYALALFAVLAGLAILTTAVPPAASTSPSAAGESPTTVTDVIRVPAPQVVRVVREDPGLRPGRSGPGQSTPATSPAGSPRGEAAPVPPAPRPGSPPPGRDGTDGRGGQDGPPGRGGGGDGNGGPTPPPDPDNPPPGPGEQPPQDDPLLRVCLLGDTACVQAETTLIEGTDPNGLVPASDPAGNRAGLQ